MKFIWALCALAVAGCKPNDSHILTVKQRVDSGETVVFSEPGSRLPNCGKGPDWTGLRGLPTPDRERVILGKQLSVVNPGTRACYRIGSRILLDQENPAMGSVVVSAIALSRLDYLRAKDLRGRYFSSRQEFDSYAAGLKTRMKGDEKGYIYIIHFSYVAGSAVDEAEIHSRDVGPDYEEAKPGRPLDSCDTWKDVVVAAEFLQPIQNGTLGSYFSLGRKNCLVQGRQATVRESLDPNSPALLQVKLLKIKRFRLSYIKPEYFDLRGFSFETLKEFIVRGNTRNEEYLTVMDLEVVAPGGTHP